MAIEVFLPAGWQRFGVDCCIWHTRSTTLGDLLQQLQSRWPNLTCQLSPPDVSVVTFFVNSRAVHPNHWRDQPLKDGDQVDILVPISGG